ncbi:hypothetical protein [Rubellicoccus peritrichatus]|uniref:Uncharacterized protein n=1 Tax=Rubellicoccus peritrichatus TaxID=3080537 RepID=A0AAQ3QUH5_9BACT|nr:hypothetical protein [Puniceicoccus sp. CR14]WOO39722.1 hypothetical protein RZN69_13950 [Puniceicoccus sp. CR14]
MVQARQNALLGLQTALGQLQLQMGPDQRVSASGELIKSSGDSTVPEIASNDPRRHWIGVWDASGDAFEGGAADASHMFWPNVPNDGHLSWLVSGIEDDKGMIPTINTNTDDSGFPVDSSIALIAGSQSVGEGNVEDFVFAPKVEISTASNNDFSSGAYAYWISDEAQKAPFNLVDDRYTDDSIIAQSRKDLMAPERVGLNAVEGWEVYDLENNDLASSFERSIYLDDISLLGNDDWGSAISDSFHDVGVSATMLQVDVRNGGLKKDLNLLFELSDADFDNSPFAGNPDSTRSDNPETDGSGYLDPYVDGHVSYLFKQPVPETSSDAFLRGPTWHYLRSYYNLYKDVSSVNTEPTITSRAYRPNTVDYDTASGYVEEFAMRYNYINVMDSTDNGDVERRNNFVNTKVQPIKWWEIGGGMVDVPRLTEHEVAPIAVRLYLVFSLVQVSLDHVHKIARDEFGNPILFSYVDGGGVTQESEDGWTMEDTGPGNIIALKMQPIAVLWNPYNVKISFNAYKLRFVGPKIAFTFSWREVGSLVEEGSYSATLNNLLKAATPVHHVDGHVINRNIDYIEFLITNPPDGSNAITLEPGEQRIFSAADERSMADIRAGNNPLFMEPGWHTNGGILLYRSQLNSRHRLRQERRGRGIEIDNIPAHYEVSIDDVYWVSDSGYPTAYADENTKIVNLDWQDYLLTDTSSIPTGGDFLTEDNALRSIGGAFFTPSGEGVNDVFEPMENLGISPLDFTTTSAATGDYSYGAYPFMYMEVRLNPANTDLGVSTEMLGNSNPFAILGSSKHSGDTIPDRFGVFFEPMAGFADYNTLRPETFLNDTRTYFGYGYGVDAGSPNTILQEVPTAPLGSLGSLQHANISRSGFMPRNAIGNAQATPFVPSSELDLSYQMQGSWPVLMQPTMYDISYLSNEALFDTYYFSSLAPEVGESSVRQRLDLMIQDAESALGPQLPNGRFVYLGDNDYAKLESDLTANDGYLKSAAYWAPEGGFNINSTSVDAWKAFLGANIGRSFDFYDGSSIGRDTANGALFSRFSLPNTEVGTESDNKDDWNAPISLDHLDGAQGRRLDALAESIVDEVKLRGPFFSLSDFVNRRPGSQDVNQQKQGTLERAIDRSGINDTIKVAGDEAYDWVNDNEFHLENTMANTATGIPGWLTQADVLTPLAPYISARSDTFVIRAYGEVVSGFSSDNVSRAWCEALVQRVPDYMDSSANSPWDEVSGLESNGANETFGRRFEVIGFRWLTKDDV